MTETEFTWRCNLKGFKYQLIRNYITFNGRQVSMLVMTKGSIQIRLTVFEDDLNRCPEQVFRKAWDIVLQKAKEEQTETVGSGGNTLWEEACRQLFAKEGRHER